MIMLTGISGIIGFVLDLLLIGLICFAAWVFWSVYKSSRKKQKIQPTATMSAPVKLTQTVSVKFQKLINDLNNHLRTPEVIKAEIEQLFDQFYSDKSKEFKSVLTEINTALINLKATREQTAALCQSLHKQIEDMKHQYKTTGKETFAQFGAELVSKQKRCNGNLEFIDKQVEELKLKQTEMGSKCNMFAAEYHIRRNEVLLKIINYKTSSPDFSNLKIDDLVNEFEIKSGELQVEAKVDQMMNPTGSSEPVIDTADVEAFKKSCK